MWLLKDLHDFLVPTLCGICACFMEYIFHGSWCIFTFLIAAVCFLLPKSLAGAKMIPKALTLFLTGGSIYVLVELLFRQRSHISMFFLGGICFLLIGGLNEYFPWEMPLVSQMVTSAVLVTVMEFVFGVILNIVFGLHIWDYSKMPYNICGQICLLFSVAWFFVSLVAIVLDDYIRWVNYGEDKPHYNLLYCKHK